LDKFLESPRSLHVSFFVPDDKLPCQKSINFYEKAKETKKCLHRDDNDDDDLVEFCQL
jgi:hypothetical protein